MFTPFPFAISWATLSFVTNDSFLPRAIEIASDSPLPSFVLKFVSSQKSRVKPVLNLSKASIYAGFTV